jgi:hypothetical protein
MSDKVLITQYELVVVVETEDQAEKMKKLLREHYSATCMRINRKELVSQNDGTYKFRITEAVNAS